MLGVRDNLLNKPCAIASQVVSSWLLNISVNESILFSTFWPFETSSMMCSGFSMGEPRTGQPSVMIFHCNH